MTLSGFELLVYSLCMFGEINPREKIIRRDSGIEDTEDNTSGVTEHSPSKDITISVNDVMEFKRVHCDENAIIKTMLTKEFLQYLEGKILDVGGGTADILSEVLPEGDVAHLDVLDFSHIGTPEAHQRITGDFFDASIIEKLGPIDTLFMSHVQQFIDSDLEKLRTAIQKVNAKRIILIEDINDDFLGDVMKFSLQNFSGANPEVKIEGFPYGYNKTKSDPFTATLASGTFSDLTKQCLYLMDVAHTEENLTKMQGFLEQKLSSPTFTINQEINVYEK